MTQKEHRLFSRFPCFHELEGTDTATGHHHRYEALNLSLTGIGIWLKDFNHSLVPGQSLALKVSGSRSIQADVCWCSGSKAGLRFVGTVSQILDSFVGDILTSMGRLPALTPNQLEAHCRTLVE